VGASNTVFTIDFWDGKACSCIMSLLCIRVAFCLVSLFILQIYRIVADVICSAVH